MKNPFKDLPENVGELHTAPIVRRYEKNPLVTRKDVPYPATLVFNAGVAKYRGLYYMAPRVDLFDAANSRPALAICTGFGTSADGLDFDFFPEPVRVHYGDTVLPWVCDARLTVLEDALYLTFCFVNQHSERPGIARWRGKGVDFDVVNLGIPQQRNMVLFPEKIHGKYMRLERPSNQWDDPFHIWYALSPDLKYWGEQELFLGCEDVPFANRKIGAGAPPVKTDRGWLLIFHAVDQWEGRTATVRGDRTWNKRYTAGAALFDLDEPEKLVAITKTPLLVAETPYETGNPELWTEFTVFPCGAVPEDDGDTLRIYYGAGDATTNLAFVSLRELWSFMTPCTRTADRAVVPFRIEEWKK